MTVQDASLHPLSWPPWSCKCLGTTASAVYLHIPGPTPNTSLSCSMYAQWKSVQPWGGMQQPGPPSLFVGSDQVVFYHWPALPCSPAASPSRCAPARLPHRPPTQASTAMCWRRVCNHWRPCWWPASLQLPVSSLLSQAFAAGLGRHHSMCICNQPPPLHRQQQLVATTECVNTNSSGHHRCLPWYLAADLERVTEDVTRAYSHCGTLQGVYQGSHSCQ